MFTAMRLRELTAATLVPMILVGECASFLETHDAFAMPPEQTHYHAPWETRGEFLESVAVASASGTNVTTVSRSFYAGFSPDSEIFPDSLRVSVTVTPMPRQPRRSRSRDHQPYPFRDLLQESVSGARAHTLSAPRLHIKRFLFRRP